jgi:predicted dehydrogenase
MKSVALIGNGYWGDKIRGYIPEYFNLKYIADSKFNLKDIWEDEEISGVIIATPIDTHYEIAKLHCSIKSIFLLKNQLLKK